MILRKLFLIILVCFIRSRKVHSSEEFLSIPPKKLNHADYLVSFKLFNTNIPKLQVLSTKALNFINTKPEDIALSSFHTFNNNVPQHLSKGKFDLKTNCHSKI